VPQLIGVVHVAIQFPLYEYLKSSFAKQGDKTITDLTPLELIASASLAKIVASCTAYPHEVLRSRFQYQNRHDPTAYTGLRDAVTRILKDEGLKGFYRGMGSNLLRVTPSCAITFTTYELLFRYL